MTTQLELPARKSFHAAALASSKKLQRVLAFLKLCGGAGATTMEINNAFNSTRGSSDISELRYNGIQIDCIPEGVNENGAQVNRFVLRETIAMLEIEPEKDFHA